MFILTVMDYNLPSNFMGSSHQGYVRTTMTIISFLRRVPPAAHRVEVILAPCSIDVVIFIVLFFSPALIPIKVSNLQQAGGLSKKQSTKLVQLEGYG